jgi:hypothetical protein
MTKATGWTKAEIIGLVESNDRAVERAVLALYARQTDDEQTGGYTGHLNARGFNKADASYGSYCARWVKKGNHLTGKHLGRCRALVKKYHRQLVEEANLKLARALVEAFTALAARAEPVVEEPKLGAQLELTSVPSPCDGCYIKAKGNCSNGWIWQHGSEYPCITAFPNYGQESLSLYLKKGGQ